MFLSRYVVTLGAPISIAQRMGEDTLTYLNKGMVVLHVVDTKMVLALSSPSSRPLILTHPSPTLCHSLTITISHSHTLTLTPHSLTHPLQY